MVNLKEKGWNLTEVGVNKLTDNGKNNDLHFLVKQALNTDLRDIGHNILPTELKGSKYDVPTCGLVLQVVKVRNVSAPRANEESKTAPRLLRIHLTDGQSIIPAVEYESLSNLSLNTVPGTKILLKNGPILVSLGNLLLKSQNIEILGGHVESLAEKWEISRTMAKFAKTGARSNSAAPPWIPFGQKIDTKSLNLNIKSLSNDPEKETAKENLEFNAQRSEAIAEASKAATGRKVFGGGQKMMDHNVQKIVDKGYSEEDAHHALKISRNDLGRAMRFLKKQNNPEDRHPRREERNNDHPRRGGGRGGGRGGASGYGRNNAESEEVSGKPSGKISLFDFLENKLPAEVAATTEVHRVENYPQHQQRRQNPSTSERYHQQPRRQFDDNSSRRPPPSRGSAPLSDSRRRTNPPRNSNSSSSSLAKAMDNMSLSGKEKQQDYGKAFPQIPNGFDPSRIMGFQNQQTNEYARNVLKQQHPEPSSGSTQPSAALAWQWHIGDRCLAKYWEDGKYYNAEVTGITEKTCVVAFLDYGNYEEVLKEDCLPITMDNSGGGERQQASRQQYHHQSGSGGGRHHPSHRNDRPLYAPPRK